MGIRFIGGIALFLLTVLATNAATNDLSSALQKGLFEEEANHDLPAAIRAYQAVVSQFDKDRKLAATAVFRLGECYRKQGKLAEARTQYERVVREFPDQPVLTQLSRAQLSSGKEMTTTTGVPTASPHEVKGPRWVNQIVIDNEEAQFDGNWTRASSSADRFGDNYMFASTIPEGYPTATAIFKPKIEEAGSYHVEVTHSQGQNRATNALWQIVSEKGTNEVTVNQQLNGGVWTRIASNVTFSPGAKHFVQLANNAGNVGFVVVADAVRFVPADEVAEEGFQSLFDGDLSQWKGDLSYWSVIEGAITAQAPADAPRSVNTCLIWQGGNVSNFELRFEFKFKMAKASDLATSGVVYRGRRVRDWDVLGYECRINVSGDNIGMLTSRDRNGLISMSQKTIIRPDATGQDRVYLEKDLLPVKDLASLVKKDDWNEMIITAQGNRLQHRLNGVLVADLTDNNDRKRLPSGLLALELNTGMKSTASVQFKNIRLKHLSDRD